ncbi:MAG: Wzz/FepE/Etk N-terminal domain-containing protein [Lachnospira sp.]|nr:Wzz/FepE/Etk N-terminal domain-containing protein [Lachnospira sp.]
MASVRNQTERDNDDVVEINLAEVGRAIFHRIWLVILAGVVAGAVAFAISRFFITPMYTSTAQVIVLTDDSKSSSLANLQASAQLTSDYAQLMTSPTVLRETIQDLNLTMEEDTLKKRITITNPTNTRILIITASDPDPERAQRIVNAISQNGSEYITQTLGVTTPNISGGEVADKPSSPNVKKNTAVGLLIGVLLAIVWIIVSMLVNDTMTTEDDVEKYLNLTVLASVPDRGADAGKRR